MGTSLLRGRAHEGVDQLLQNDLAGDGLRHLDDGREIEVFNQRPNRARGIPRSLLLPAVRTLSSNCRTLPAAPQRK